MGVTTFVSSLACVTLCPHPNLPGRTHARSGLGALAATLLQQHMPAQQMFGAMALLVAAAWAAVTAAEAALPPFSGGPACAAGAQVAATSAAVSSAGAGADASAGAGAGVATAAANPCGSGAAEPAAAAAAPAPAPPGFLVPARWRLADGVGAAGVLGRLAGVLVGRVHNARGVTYRALPPLPALWNCRAEAATAGAAAAAVGRPAVPAAAARAVVRQRAVRLPGCACAQRGGAAVRRM